MPSTQNLRPAMFLVAAAVILAALFGMDGGTNDEREALREVRIAFQTIPNGEAIVKEQRWLEAALAEYGGVQVRWINFASGSDVNAALASGDIDIGLVGSTLFATGIERRIPYSLIWIHNVIGENEALVVHPDRGVSDVADLAGKNVATPFGSTTHYTLLSAIHDAGLSPREVTLLDMKPRDIASAWVRGDLDAAYVWEPTLSQLEALGARVLLSSHDLVVRGIVTADLGVVRTEFLRQHPDIVDLYMRAQVEAVRFIKAHPEEAARIVAEAFDIQPDQARSQMQKLIFLDGCEQTSPSWLERDIVATVADTAAFLHGQGLLSSVPAPEHIAAGVDTDPLNRILGACPAQ